MTDHSDHEHNHCHHNLRRHHKLYACRHGYHSHSPQISKEKRDEPETTGGGIKQIISQRTKFLRKFMTIQKQMRVCAHTYLLVSRAACSINRGQKA